MELKIYVCVYTHKCINTYTFICSYIYMYLSHCMSHTFVCRYMYIYIYIKIYDNQSFVFIYSEPVLWSGFFLVCLISVALYYHSAKNQNFSVISLISV